MPAEVTISLIPYTSHGEQCDAFCLASMRTAELQKYAGVFPDEFMSEVESLLKRRFRFAH